VKPIMKIKKGQKQAVSIFQHMTRRLADQLPRKTPAFFLSLLLGALLAVARRRTVTAWLQAAQIEDEFRQAFDHMPNIGRKSQKLFDAMWNEILKKLGSVVSGGLRIGLAAKGNRQVARKIPQEIQNENGTGGRHRKSFVAVFYGV
jgi:hypothetical protein